MIVLLAEPAKKSEAVDEGHAQVEDDGVRFDLLGLAQTCFRGHRGADVETLEPQHPRERLGHSLVVVDDKDGRARVVAGRCAGIGAL